MTTLTAQRVEEILVDCLYYGDDDEMPDPMPTLDDHPDDMLIIDAIVDQYALRHAKVEEHFGEICDLLMQLPHEFRQTGGGGWSFLNSCVTADGEQWTGLHRTMAQLWALGIAAGVAAYQMPRDLWPILPGGMPYLVILDRVEGSE
jgi:hypothetical protein